MLVRIIKSGVVAENCRVTHKLVANQILDLSANKMFASRIIELGYAEEVQDAPKKVELEDKAIKKSPEDKAIKSAKEEKESKPKAKKNAK